ncbi:MAG TPA: hypothetical protein EYP71_02090 [Dehalococcoidia bacterium]|nr:hypothetical protein [Dehalococcoidia bacterium]
MNTSQWHFSGKWLLLVVVSALFLTSACGSPSPPSPPPPPPPSPNQYPTISSLIAAEEVATLAATEITCRATDPDGDILDYRWSADGGSIEGKGYNITWRAPDTTGDYTITVMVTDGKGGTATASTTIRVIEKPNQPPLIVSLTKDGSPPEEENRVREWRTITLQCIAADPDGDKLTYLWRATGGKINGQGHTVGWTSPGVPGNYTVTVIVTDGRGGQAEKSIEFKVVCCGG